MSNEAVCRTAPATPGMSIIRYIEFGASQKFVLFLEPSAPFWREPDIVVIFGCNDLRSFLKRGRVKKGLIKVMLSIL